MTTETDPLDRKPVVNHPDAEASNALANYVTERMYPYVHRGHTLFSARYGIAGDFLHWLDEHRPGWNDTRTVAQVKAEALREAATGFRYCDEWPYRASRPRATEEYLNARADELEREDKR